MAPPFRGAISLFLLLDWGYNLRDRDKISRLEIVLVTRMLSVNLVLQVLRAPLDQVDLRLDRIHLVLQELDLILLGLRQKRRLFVQFDLLRDPPAYRCKHQSYGDR